MKNLIFYLLFVTSFLLSSCSSGQVELDNSPENNVNIEITLPISEDIRTRAFSDGLSINNLICYAYVNSIPVGNKPDIVTTIPLHNYAGKPGAYYSLALPKNASYDLVFVATSCSQESNSKIYYNTQQRTLNLNYDKISQNDEGLDCFWGVIKNVSPNSYSYKVTLKRPFAQLNIGSKDVSSTTPLSVSVDVKGVYSSFNVMDGSVSGKTNISLAKSSVPTGQTYPVSGYDYLSMNYLLVNERTNVDVSMTVDNQGMTSDCTFDNVPIQRNYRTNVYGNLLTADNNFEVEISSGFQNKIDNEVDFHDYDLVFKVLPNTSSIIFKGNGRSIELIHYKDSQNTIKVTWEQIGVKYDGHVEFDGVTQLSIHGTAENITEILKFDISTLPNLYSLETAFAHCANLKDVDFVKSWDTSRITNMTHAFSDCRSVTNFDLSNFNTYNVTEMRHMFANCFSATNFNLSSFNTSNVEYFDYMFSNCRSVTSLDVSNFDTSNTRYSSGLNYMFTQCWSLSYIDLSNFVIPDGANRSSMFDGSPTEVTWPS